MILPLHSEPVSQVFIALGSNLENPLSQVRRGMMLLAGLEQIGRAHV